MVQRDIVVIGGSAGSIEALLALVRGLPPDLAAAVFVVVHVPPGSVSRLPDILARAGAIPAHHVQQGEPIIPGNIYVAPPDRHLLVRGGWVELSRGPRENHSRPAIDPLFRSAARTYGTRAIGVVLSGALSDGTAGLMAVKAQGGLAVIQDPNEAVMRSMPQSALAAVRADRVLPAGQIGAALARLTGEQLDDPEETRMVDEAEKIARVIEQDFAAQAADSRAEESSIYTCPDCGGVMWQAEQGANGWFRCHVGHAHSPESLLAQKSEEVEAALWASVRLLREKATLTRQTVARSRAAGNTALAARIEEQAHLDEQHARVIRELLETSPNPGDQALVVIDALDEASNAR